MLEPLPEEALSSQDPGLPPSYHERFEDPFQSVSQTRGRWTLRGTLDPDWKIRPLVNEFEVRTQEISENVYEGAQALRLQVEYHKHTYVDLSPKEGFPADKTLRVQFAARSPSTARIDLGMMPVDTKSSRLTWSQKRVYVPAEWMTLDVMIPPRSKEAGKKEQLVFRISESPTSLELDDVKVWVLEPEDLNRGIPEQEGNLLPTLGFPTGLPNGWSVGNAGTPHLVGTDTDTLSPVGTPALRVQRGAGFLCTPSFQALGGKETQIDFWIKGHRAGQKIRMQLMAPPRFETERFVIGPEWQRIQVSMPTPFPLEGFQVIKIHSPNGEYWIDSMVVSQQGTADEIRAQKRKELRLSHEEYYGIQDEGTPLELKVHIQGSGDSDLEMVVQDMYGRRFSQGKLSLPAGENNLRFSQEMENSLPPLGTYRVELRLLDRGDGQPGPWSEFILHRLRRPRMEGRFAADSPFGTHATPSPTQSAMVKRLGFNWVRMHDAGGMLKWFFVEPEPGQVSYAAGENQVDTYRAAHLNVLTVLDGSPPWASDLSKKQPKGPYRGYWDKHWVPRDMKAWQAYCQGVIEHFDGKVDAWEIWNEPYVGRFFQLNWNAEAQRIEKGSPEDYSRIAHQAHEAWSRTQKPPLLMASKAGDWGKASIEKAGIPSGIHLISFHVYTPQHQGFSNDVVARHVDSIREISAGVGREDLLFWNTEGGPGPANHHYYRHLPPRSHSRYALHHANGLVRMYLSHLMSDVDKFFLYSFHGAGNWQHTWAVIGHDDSLPPHASALSNLFWMLEGKKLVERLQVQDGYLLRFRSEEEELAVWVPALSRQTPLELPGEFQAFDLFGNRYEPNRVRAEWPLYVALKAGSWESLQDTLK